MTMHRKWDESEKIAFDNIPKLMVDYPQRPFQKKVTDEVTKAALVTLDTIRTGKKPAEACDFLKFVSTYSFIVVRRCSHRLRPK